MDSIVLGRNPIERRLEGIGGWLLFFVLTLTVFRPLTGLIRVYTTIEANPAVRRGLGAAYPAVRAGEWLIIIADIAICLFAAWRLVRVRRWSSVRVAIASMVVSMLVVGLGQVVFVALATGRPFSLVAAGMPRGLIQGGGYVAIWTAYLLRSRRVENTYPLAPLHEGLGEVFT